MQLHDNEIIVDNFAGGGGASLGIEMALGRSPDIAINHDAEAIAMHRANHPATRHFCENIRDVDPVEACDGRPVGLAWFSPDCCHFSKAKGSKPVKKEIRGLARNVIHWARKVRPRVIILENVEEFCFPPETAVLSKRGMIPIGDLKIGDEVWTHNARWKPVTAISRRLSETVSIAGYGNSIVEATPNHQFYARQYAPRITRSGKNGRHEVRLLEPEWVRADCLAGKDETSAYMSAYSGYAWASPIELPRYWMRLPETLGVNAASPAFFYMIGRWLGDGWIRKRKTRQRLVRICANLDEADRLGVKLAETGLAWHRSRHSESVDVFDLAADSSKLLVRWLTNNFGQFADRKTLPAWVFGAPEELRWALIEGYHDSDGHEQENGLVGASSVSRCLAVGIRLLLHSLGISASISKIDSREVPWVGDPDRTMTCQAAYKVSWRRENQWEKGHRSELHIWGRVREVVPAQQKTEVVDITVADDHSFVADGQVVHNCDWGPLLPNNMPDPARKGRSFNGWLSHLTRLGYRVAWRELRACDYGAPTIRKRLFVVARCDGLPIEWPDPTHGDPRKIGRNWFDRDLKPWRTAAECIDWSIPCPSIFERARPLAENTLRRIAAGIRRYVIEAAEPFIVNLTHHGSERVEGLDEPFKTVTGANRGEKALVTPYLAGVGGRAGQSPERSVDSPYQTVTAKADAALLTPYLVRIGQTNGNGKYTNDLREPVTTITSKAEHLIVVPTLIQTGYGERDGQAPRVPGLGKPLGTAVAGGQKHALVSAFLAKHHGGVVGMGSGMGEPIGTVTTADHHSLVTSHLVKLRGTCRDGQPVTEPMATVSAQGTHIGEVRAFLLQYNGRSVGSNLNEPIRTATTKDRMGLVTIHGDEYVIADIGLRMLTPRELFRAQGFGDKYIIDPEFNGKPLSKTAQVRMCGNSVAPPIAAAVARAQFETVPDRMAV